MRFENTTLGQLSIKGKGSYGIAASAVPYSDELFTYLRITDINDDGTINKSGLMSVSEEKAEQYLLKPNDIVFARTGGSTGRNYFYDGSDGEFVFAGFLIRFSIDDKKVNPLFIKYYCQSQIYKGWVHSFNTGSTRGNINAQTYANMPIILPPREQQDLLVNTLSVIDAKIAVNKAINENLEQQAQAIFKSWFVDFEPFGGVMPDDWRAGTFSDIIESTLGGDWGKEASTGNYTERVYCIRGADIPEVKAGNKGKMPTRYILSKNLKNKKLIANDIVVEISGGSPTQSTGRVAAISQSLLDRYDCGMVCTNFCRAIKPCEGYSYYTYYYWQYLYDRNVFFSYENGTTGIKNLDLSGFVETESIIIPSIKAIQEFNSLIDSFHSRVFKNGQENENIAALRDTLLPKLMNGEIDVSNVRI